MGVLLQNVRSNYSIHIFDVIPFFFFLVFFGFLYSRYISFEARHYPFQVSCLTWTEQYLHGAHISMRRNVIEKPKL